MTHDLSHAPLGQSTHYPDRYDSSLLFPIARQTIIDRHTTYIGWDFWRGYELSWLNPNGLPQVAILKLNVPCQSPFITESKSLKLYLNSFNQEQFDSWADVARVIQRDLSHTVGAAVDVEIVLAQDFHHERIEEPDAHRNTEINIDHSSTVMTHYQPAPELLKCRTTAFTNQTPPTIKEALFSRLLKSNCPVTNQPDWASVHIQYEGLPIDHDALLAYIVSYRRHQGFHEQCVETIFADIMTRCQPTALSVYARYTRRGGLDINPWRATPGMPPPTLHRSAQQ